MLPWQVDKMEDVQSSVSPTSDVYSVSPSTQVFVPEQPNPEVTTHCNVPYYHLHIHFIACVCVRVCVCVCVCVCVRACTCIWHACMCTVSYRPIATATMTSSKWLLCEGDYYIFVQQPNSGVYTVLS